MKAQDKGTIETVFDASGRPWALLARRRGNGWARVYIEQGGNVVASSDWGTFSYWWSDPGGDESESIITRVARFLCGCDRHYLIRKFNGGRNKVFDGARTSKLIRESIVRYRKVGALDKGQAREEWEFIDEMDSEADFGRWLEDTSLIDAWKMACYDYEPSVYDFVDNVILGWLVPLLREHLQAYDRERSQEVAAP